MKRYFLLFLIVNKEEEEKKYNLMTLSLAAVASKFSSKGENATSTTFD